MKTIISTITAGILAVFMGLTSIGAANAAPIAVQTVPVASQVEQVQYREHRRWDRRDDRRKRWDRRDRREHRYESRRDRRGYWNGHRGYREQRRGYRRHNDGYWYPRVLFRL